MGAGGEGINKLQGVGLEALLLPHDGCDVLLGGEEERPDMWRLCVEQLAYLCDRIVLNTPRP
jgi:hypothetical protein